MRHEPCSLMTFFIQGGPEKESAYRIIKSYLSLPLQTRFYGHLSVKQAHIISLY